MAQPSLPCQPQSMIASRNARKHQPENFASIGGS